MLIRDLEKRDLPILEQWHKASGFDYPFPDLFSDQFVKVMVLVDENDVPMQCIAGKKLVEMFFWLDPGWRNPRWRLEALMQGHEAFRAYLHANKWGEVTAFLPPEIAKSFGRKLQRIFNWIPGRWQHFSRKTEKLGGEE